MTKYAALIAIGLATACRPTSCAPDEAPPAEASGSDSAPADEGSAPEPAPPPAPPEDPLAVDHTRPDAVVDAIFRTVEDGQMARLVGLCDPEGSNDENTRRLCAMRYSDKAAFLELFERARVAGPAVLSADGHTAQVPIMYGRDGKQPATVVVVQRPSGWFLLSY